MGTIAPLKPMIFDDMATRPPSRLALNFKNIPYSASSAPLLKTSQSSHPLDVPASRKLENNSKSYTLPILIDPNTNTKLEGSFEIATYLQQTYPAAGAGDLFAPQRLDFIVTRSKDLTLFVLFLDQKEIMYKEYSKFNVYVDAVFTSHALLMYHQELLDPDTAKGSKAEFFRRVGESWADFEVKGEEREKLKASLRSALGHLGRLFKRDITGPFLLGQRTSYADIIVGGWLRIMCVALPGDEWEEVKSWHGGIFGNLHDALEKYTEVN
ncbi:uncharacterized protein N7483_008666 [Penicillium malachiteum]|uniref:uncharacterized protein n=1 Tax=Penicillium malachiteum TaxID=1324776 RepID=UPI0025481B83|nr:uncharacterized protein N7483_008666 [Penicillium malachiteum]KAJ5720732.1 hypothetical protein N7483_008666 [Penicillium malachiteum]